MPLTEQSKTVPTSNQRSSTSSPRTPRSFTNSSSGRKKNSGGKKFRGRKSSPKPVAKREPVFEYVSACCSIRAAKPPVAKPTDKKSPLSSLGSWRCTGCKKRCKVTRQKPAPPVDASVAVPGTEANEANALEVTVVT